MNALELQNVTKSYGDYTLGPISLALPAGTIMGLVGENGAGKSTMMKLLLHLIRPDSGTVSLFGKTGEDMLCAAKEDIGAVQDTVGLPEMLNLREIDAVLSRTFADWDEPLWQSYLDRFALPQKKPFKTFSRGMKMKAGIAAALSHHPKLLLLDEATSGLDPVIREELLDLFNEFTRDETHSILISSHIVTDLEKICDTVAFLHRGTLLLCEEKDALREQYGVMLCSKEEARSLPGEAVVGIRENPYGAEVLVRRTLVPHPENLHPADLEQLFVSMVKGGFAV